MKKITIILTIAFAASTLMLNAQDEKAAPSPFCKIEQKVGTTDITIEYSRPGVKDRTVFGDLVPYDKKWRTGANSATKISFSKDVKVEGKELSAGSYAILTTPGKDSWDIHFFEYSKSSVGTYTEAKPILTVSAETGSLNDNAVESFLIYIDFLRDNSGVLTFIWDKSFALVDLSVM